MKRLALKLSVAEQIPFSSFKKKVVLLEHKKSQKKKNKRQTIKKQRITLKAKPHHNLYSKVSKIPNSMQNELAENLYTLYFENSQESQKQSNIAWGAGFLIPSVLEAVSTAAGISSINLPAAIAANLIFATAFRYTFGKKMVSSSQEIARIKAKKAVDLLLSGRITSEYAQDRLSMVVPQQEIYTILTSGYVKSEKAQLTLIKRLPKKLSHEMRRNILNRNVLSTAAKRLLGTN